MPMRRSTDFPSASLFEEVKRRWRYIDDIDRQFISLCMEVVYEDALMRGLAEKGDRLSMSLLKQLKARTGREN